MGLFTLHPQLEADSYWIGDLPLSQLRLNNQQAIPWMVLVPRRVNIQEIYQLDQKDRMLLIEEMAQVSDVFHQLYKPDKINIGALGNIVPQLHVHIMARFKSDPAWPKPVWGNMTSKPYGMEALNEIKTKWQEYMKL